MDQTRIVLLQLVLWTVRAPTAATSRPRDPRAALDEYVNAFDPHYSYTVLDNLTRRGSGFTRYVLNVTTLQWLNESLVDRPVWWHYMTVTVPLRITPGLEDAALFFVDAGDNGERPPSHTSGIHALIAAFAVSSGTVSACISQIPNQPLSFPHDGGKSRKEDSLMAYTWWQFLTNHKDPHWLLLFPMTKACVRGMDAVTDFVLKVSAGRQRIDRFTVSGASKRGWAAWLLAAVDSRVVSLVSIVLDILNMRENLHHHFRAYGGWSFAFQSYYNLNLTKLIDSPQMELMANLIDPLAYSERYRRKPKLLVSAGGDEFFLPDGSQYYYPQLQGEKHLRVLPNAEHQVVGHWLSVLRSTQAFYFSTMLGLQQPTMHWNRTQSESSGAISLRTDTPPIQVLAYEAITWGKKRRDFRWFVAWPGRPGQILFRPIPWRASPVSNPSPGVYVKKFRVPKVGWRAFFIEATFSGPFGTQQTFTTEVQIIPDSLPFPDCKGKGCHGTLV